MGQNSESRKSHTNAFSSAEDGHFRSSPGIGSEAQVEIAPPEVKISHGASLLCKVAPVGMHHFVWAEDNFEALFLWLIRARLGRQEPEVCNKTL